MTTAPRPDTTNGGTSDERRQWERDLADVKRQGPTRVAELFLASMRGDGRAAALPIGPVLRALPGIDWLTARDMLLRAGVRHEDTAIGAISGPQRAALAAELAQLPQGGEER
ncbi:hypothetical protein [Streptacidiphilus neutrinimicus]|uniref:hypothetical protein n=1 Tax=Streptacidiphilus neutrinimicus TaxID=105420 RepID=UPI0005AA6798|nr:hypothetical protein [Streptacidiphilus neutrinimicus]